MSNSSIGPRTGKALSRCIDWAREQKDRTVHCRECDCEVTVRESVCPRCGASDPARIPWSAVTAVVAIGVSVMIAILMVF